MLKRDIAIIIVSFVALFFSLQHDGTITFRKAWYHELHVVDSHFQHGHEEMLAPVVADLNGDGLLEVVAATHDFKLQVIRPRPAGRGGEGFAAADQIAEVSLLPNKVAVGTGRRVAALAVGYVEAESDAKVRPLRKQVVVAVTESWHVMCFDHNLKLLWERVMPVTMPKHARMAEVGIHISPHIVHPGDRGMVIVGGSVETTHVLAGQDVDGLTDEEVLSYEEELEREVLEREKSAGHLGKLEDLDQEDSMAGVDTRRHFSYFAFEGFTGEERWRHDNTSFHKDLEQLASETHPQNNYRLDADKVNARHYGEAACRDYRESVLYMLPHLWNERWDTRLEAAHFVQHKAGKGAQKHLLADKKSKGHSKHIAGVGSSTPLAKLMHRTPPAPLHRTPLHHHHRHKNTTAANAIVAYLHEGIEVIHLYTGRTICQLHLPDSILHADINGDGVLEHVHVQHEFEEEPGELSVDGTQRLGACRAIIRAGIPPTEHIADLVFCDPNQVHRDLAMAALGHVEEDEFEGLEIPVEVAPPAFLPLPRLGGEYGPKTRQHGLLVFMVNHGEITAFDHYGSEMWQVNMGTIWNNPHSEIPTDSTPTLHALALAPHAIPSAILAAGEKRAVILSEHGSLLDELDLPHPPTHPIIVDDFNGDGLNDLIVVTQKGYYGYAQGRHVGAVPLSTLVCVLLVAMGIVYYSQQHEMGSKKSRRTRTGLDYGE